MNQNGAEFVEIFLQEASDRLQYLREYSNVLLDAYPAALELERLYIAAHTLAGTSASYGFPLFSEIAAKLAHIFQYAIHASIAPEAAAPLLEFISEGVALLESDLILVSSTGDEAADDVATFKQRYPFAFPAAVAPAPEPQPAALAQTPARPEREVVLPEIEIEAQAPLEEVPVAIQPESAAEPLPQDDDVPAEILEFFVPEAEEHLQIVTQCLLALEESPSEDQVHRMFRSMHTIKGSAAQVGLHRISHVAHRVEDLIGRVRDGELRPTAQIIDVCLESVDVLKKFIYRQWSSDSEMQRAVQSLSARVAGVPLEVHVAEVQQPAKVQPPAEEPAQVQSAASHLFSPEEEALLAEYAQAKTAFADAQPAPVAQVQDGSEKADDELPRREFQPLPQARSVRVALERLDRMMNAVGELVINRTRMIGRLDELEHLADVLNLAKSRMQEKVAEFQEKHEFSRIHMSGLRPQEPFIPGNGSGYSYPLSAGQSPSEFSELEMDRYDDFNILSRSLTEISADITEVLSQLGGFVRRVDSDIDEFTKLAHRLQDEITQARMVPIGNLYTRLSRTVRDAAKAAGRRAELKLEGAETELDNNIIQQISDPLIHLVRNSVAHGIEREEERYDQGKSDVGTVAVRAYHRGNHIFIEVEDDGRGIDYEQVRRRAVELGIVYADAAADLTQEELLDMLFQPGFSTASRKTELAGRGVGLDVVRSNLVALNGEIEVHSEPGRGTRFTLKVPLTLVIAQALFVRCGQTTFAIPLTFIQEIRRVRVDEIREVDGKMMTSVREAPTEVLRVDMTLGLDPIQPVNDYYRMVVVSATGRQVGLIVEDVVRKDEIVIKNLGEYLRKVKMFPGATIAPDGRLILLLDVNRLVSIETMDRAAAAAVAAERRAIAPPPAAARIFAPGAEAVAQGAIPQEAIDVVQDEKVVVLVDDSISVRKFVGRMLEKAGYRVKLAADGLEALEIIAQTRCDLVVTDLEMPRTNGYELLSHLRNDPEKRTVPVMVVTSRAGAKHRDRAMKEGASAFLTKPVQEDHFIAAVGRLIGVSSPAAAKAEAVQ
ncbi:MAG TPA: hybrid sensor histidine kinase/response regulator [Candidatus Acidoferrales bacterium]|nr:hybrid sensor histidine kinase/response regulator [Candidatus Acidoferrales bacterium]